ncbi:unnamed protein product, partial [Mesorhabditis spiculigera]
MDFLRFPAEIQHEIVRLLGIDDFFKLASSSKTLWDICENTPGKCWGGKLWNHEPNCFKFAPRTDEAYREITLKEKALQLFFKNSSVSELELAESDFPNPGVTTKRLTLDYTSVNLLDLLKGYKTEAKYSYLKIQSLEVKQEVVLWLNECVEDFEFTAAVSLPAYTKLTIPSICIVRQENVEMEMEPFFRTIIGEWLAGKREITWICVRGDENGPNFPDFEGMATELDVAGAQAEFDRGDGKVLVLTGPQTETFSTILEVFD